MLLYLKKLIALIVQNSRIEHLCELLETFIFIEDEEHHTVQTV